MLRKECYVLINADSLEVMAVYFDIKQAYNHAYEYIERCYEGAYRDRLLQELEDQKDDDSICIDMVLWCEKSVLIYENSSI